MPSCFHSSDQRQVVPRARMLLELPSGYSLEGSLQRLYASRAFTVAIKDLPRLARRTQVITTRSLDHYFVMPSAVQVFDAGDNEEYVLQDLRTIQSVCQIVWDVFQYVESEERFAIIRAKIENILASPKPTLIEFTTRMLFEDVMKWDSKAAGVLRMVNQAVILEGMYVLRCATDKSGALQYCRDLREERGWMVSVCIGDTVTITHTRTEVCGDPSAAAAGRFELTWALSLLFSASMTALESCDLRITGIVFDPLCDNAVRASASRALSNGHLILA